MTYDTIVLSQTTYPTLKVLPGLKHPYRTICGKCACENLCSWKADNYMHKKKQKKKQNPNV